MRCSVPMAVCTVAALGLSLLTGCGSTQAKPQTAPSRSTRGWVEQSVSFAAGGLTVFGTYRHPRTRTTTVPAALLIAGSGPTDRNGNTSAVPGGTDTLRTLAHWLSDDGVATLRYDKLGSGQTGLGPYRDKPQTIGIAPFEKETAAAPHLPVRATRYRQELAHRDRP